MKPLAVCAIFKNEGPFLLEWIAYHRAVGFDHFVLYDNDSTDGGADLIRSSRLSPCCRIIHWPQRPGQLSAYQDFIRNFAANFEWAAFIDIDEFLLPLGDATISQLLQGWNRFSAVLVSWRIFGPSGWLEPPDGLVIENYDLRSADAVQVNHHIKSIVKCEDIIDVLTNPHEFRVRGAVCNTAGQPVKNIAIQPKACHDNLVLNHYATRSRQDWMAKIRRGSAMFASDELKYKEEMFDHFAEISHIKDETIKKWAPRVKAMLEEGPTVQGETTSGWSEVREHGPIYDLDVSYDVVQLEPGLFSLSLDSDAFDAAAGLPAARVSLAPGPALRPQTVSVSTFRGDGWLTAHDEPTLVRVTSGSAQILVTLYWQSGLGAASRPRLLWQTLSTDYGVVPSPGAEVSIADAVIGDPETLAHVQDVGDVPGRLGDWIGQPHSGRWIEGFQVLPHGIGPDEIGYRAVLGRNRLSPWLRGGSFCGSRGLALPLAGFCLRLTGLAAAKYECAYSARFVDGSQIGLIPSGQVCAAATLAPLEAFQIVLRPRP